MDFTGGSSLDDSSEWEEVYTFLAIPCFMDSVARNGQLRLPLMRRIPEAYTTFYTESGKSLYAEGMVRLEAPAGLRIKRFPERHRPAHRPVPTPVARQPEPIVLRPRPNIARPQQIKFPALGVTPVMAAVEAVLRRHAAATLDMPTNPVLGQLVGGRGRNTVWRALERLAALDRISIEIRDGKRRIRIMESGLVTGWGPFASNTHAPYSSRPRGAKPAPDPVRLDYKPAEGEAFRYRIEPQKLVHVGPSATCCWPMWGEGARPTHLYCGEAVPAKLRRDGHSYCQVHFLSAHEME